MPGIVSFPKNQVQCEQAYLSSICRSADVQDIVQVFSKVEAVCARSNPSTGKYFSSSLRNRALNTKDSGLLRPKPGHGTGKMRVVVLLCFLRKYSDYKFFVLVHAMADDERTEVFANLMLVQINAVNEFLSECVMSVNKQTTKDQDMRHALANVKKTF